MCALTHKLEHAGTTIIIIPNYTKVNTSIEKRNWNYFSASTAIQGLHSSIIMAHNYKWYNLYIVASRRAVGALVALTPKMHNFSSYKLQIKNIFLLILIIIAVNPLQVMWDVQQVSNVVKKPELIGVVVNQITRFAFSSSLNLWGRK